MRALISIHDVMPETLTPLGELLAALAERRLAPVTLLVVPGRAWRGADIAQLRAWARAGHELAGHGWRHDVPRVRGLRHRLHSALLSRRAAEHLALGGDGIAGLMRRNHAWFVANDLPAPSLYVPPAWALGALPGHRLSELPFRYIETLTGVHDTVHGGFRRLPVLGFEADTRLRAAGLTVSNALATRRKPPVRLAIHPGDHRLRLRRALWAYLDRVTAALAYDTLAQPVTTPTGPAAWSRSDGGTGPG